MKYILVSKSINAKSDNKDIINALEKLIPGDIDFLFLRPKESTYKLKEVKLFTKQLNKKIDNLNKEKVLVFLNAEELTVICQNSLLKLFEESPYTIVLITKNIDALLPTLRSRCQIVYLKEENIKKDKIISNNYPDILSTDNINDYAKKTRDIVKEALIEKVNTIPYEQYYKIILISDAIKKIDANCKIESILYDLIWKAGL